MMVMMRPPRCCVIEGSTALQQFMTPLKFVAMKGSHSSGDVSQNGFGLMFGSDGPALPALFTRMSILPKRAIDSLVIASTLARFVMSACRAIATPPKRAEEHTSELPSLM